MSVKLCDVEVSADAVLFREAPLILSWCFVHFAKHAFGCREVMFVLFMVAEGLIGMAIVGGAAAVGIAGLGALIGLAVAKKWRSGFSRTLLSLQLLFLILNNNYLLSVYSSIENIWGGNLLDSGDVLCYTSIFVRFVTAVVTFQYTKNVCF